MTHRTTGIIFVFSAASGAGKTTILDHLRATVPNLVYSISATTRAPRDGERNGVHYFFMSEEAFRKKADAGEFAEWQKVHGNYYGTPRSFIDATVAAGKHVVMDIDVYGKLTFDRVYPDAVGILIVPPSREALERRLRGRGTDSEETIRLRLKNADEEMRVAKEKGSYRYTIVNDELQRACAEAVELVRREIENSRGQCA
jgi:guanylate kinase